jgi:hypothetical protein
MSDDFFLLQPEDEWVEERVSERRAEAPAGRWVRGPGGEMTWEAGVYEPDPGPLEIGPWFELPWWWWNAWTGVGLVLWVLFAVWAGFPTEVGGFGAAMLIWLRWRARRRETLG